MCPARQDVDNDNTPPYVISSHKQGVEEISYYDRRYLQKLQRLPTNLRQSPDFIAALEAAAGFDFGQGRTELTGNHAAYQKIMGTAKVAKSKGCCCGIRSLQASTAVAIRG